MAMHARRGQDGTCKVSSCSVNLLKLLLLRELNDNKIAVLRYALNCYHTSVTSVLRQMNEVHGIPISTLKQAAGSLKELGLIDYGTAAEPKELTLTNAGAEALKLMTIDAVDFIATDEQR